MAVAWPEQTFGEIVTAALDARGWSQRELARAVDVDPAHICRLLGARVRSVSPELLVKVAAALDIEPEAFAEYREWRVLEAIRNDRTLVDRLYERLLAIAA